MPYVKRNSDGLIIGLSGEVGEGATEELDLDHPDVQQFLESARAHLSSTDSETIRVIEDLIDVLIQKKLLLLTDLPLAAQQKLMDRQRMRNELGVLGDLMVDEDDIL
ncbi:MAG: hypothetical protein JSU75_00150 [Gammaproteobacteria bacterium]|nr:MAG: hypothetical protein JSU75_00150 [Gammaproteobacteria bacterium]